MSDAQRGNTKHGPNLHDELEQKTRGMVLIEALSRPARELVIEVDAHTKAAGSDDQALDDAIAHALRNVLENERIRAEDRAAADDGARRAEGIEAVTEALQQARVDTLLLDAQLIDDTQTLTALDAVPWVALSGESTAGVEPLAEVPVAEALTRAALLTDARVLVSEAEPSTREPMPDRSVRPPVALLRWAEDQG